VLEKNFALLGHRKLQLIINFFKELIYDVKTHDYFIGNYYIYYSNN